MPRAPRRSPRAFTIPEVLIALAIFAMVSTALGIALLTTAQVWRRGSGRHSAMRELQRMRAALVGVVLNGIEEKDVTHQAYGRGLPRALPSPAFPDFRTAGSPG